MQQPEGASSPTPLPNSSHVFESSLELGKLFAALAKAQAQIKPAVLDMVNPAYGSPYASLTSIMEAAAPVYAHELSLLQQVFSRGAGYFVRTLLGHSSGQWIAHTLEVMIDRKNMQGLGSAITYARRYGISALLGIVDTEDDDGNAASKPPAEKPGKAPAPAPSAASKPAIKGKATQPGAIAPEPAPKWAEDLPPIGSPAAMQAEIDASRGAKDPKPAPTPAEIASLFALGRASRWSDDQIRGYMELRYKKKITGQLTHDELYELREVIATMTFQQAHKAGVPS